MVFEGVNDIGGGADTAAAQTSIGDRLIAAFKQIAADAKKAGYTTIGGTITPFAGSGYQGVEREKTRKRVNKWILESTNYDYTVDIASIIADKANVERLDPKYNGGDGLHPNVAGYQAIADAYPIKMFK
jgi:lysophospholipase L1-like esterase